MAGAIQEVKISQAVLPFTQLYVGIHIDLLTHRQPSTTIVPYANSLNLDETPSHSASYPDTSCLPLRQHFQQHWATLKQMRNLSDDN